MTSNHEVLIIDGFIVLANQNKKHSVIISGVSEAQDEKKKERKKETILPTFQPQAQGKGLRLQAVQAQRPSQCWPVA